jgi:hypothetical protein
MWLLYSGGSGGGRNVAGIRSSVFPHLVAPRHDVIRVLVVLRNHIPDVSGHLPEKRDLYDVVQGVGRSN